jgi:N6-L-threonylcarbamoyladenine synthase
VAAILGIETSCDETAAAVVTDGRVVRSNVVAAQDDLHAPFDGVVPEVASRAHLERLDDIIQRALADAGLALPDIDAVAVSHRPGLVGCLLIGVTAAKTLAWAYGRPLIAVNHIEAHATSAAMTTDVPPWPAVALVVSGGHTSLYLVEDFDRVALLGCTTDDAAGEAFDKVSTILSLGYPGGPAIDRRAKSGNPTAVSFPRTLLGDDSLDFSFSGIKTAVLYHVHGVGRTSGGLERMSAQQISDTAAGFQAAVVDVLVAKTMRGVERTGVQTVVVGGGVAANTRLRAELSSACDRAGIALHLTPLQYCTDNGAMIAFLGGHLLARGRTSALDVTVG